MTRKDDVIFVTLEPLIAPGQASGTGKAIGIGDRLSQLTGTRKKNWLTRLDAYESVFGPAKKVYPGSAPDIDVLVFRDNKDYYTLVTSGMSDRRMFMPKDSEDPRRLELEMYVKDIKKPQIDRLVNAAEFPFLEKTYLGHGDTIDWAEAITRGSNLEADLLIYSLLETHRQLTLFIRGDNVQLLWCIPITSAELDYKKEHGIDAFLDILDDANHPIALDVHRKSYI